MSVVCKKYFHFKEMHNSIYICMKVDVSQLFIFRDLEVCHYWFDGDVEIKGLRKTKTLQVVMHDKHMHWLHKHQNAGWLE